MNPVLLCFPMVCYVVHLSLGLNCMQDLGVEETLNVLDKPSVEPHNKIRVDGESTLHILKRTGREGVARGTMCHVPSRQSDAREET